MARQIAIIKTANHDRRIAADLTDARELIAAKEQRICSSPLVAVGDQRHGLMLMSFGRCGRVAKLLGHPVYEHPQARRQLPRMGVEGVDGQRDGGKPASTLTSAPRASSEATR
jgi:hypothetical protein